MDSSEGDQQSQLAEIRRELGTELRRMRLERRMSAAQLAKLVEMSASKISRIEHGHVNTTDVTARRLADALRLDDVDREFLLLRALAIEESQRRHNATTSATSSRMELPYWVKHAEAARRRKVHVVTGIPSLLQTPACILSYAIRLAEFWDVGTLMAGRYRCQALLWDRSRRFQILFFEAGLYEESLAPQDMHAQLVHILLLSRQPNIEIGIIPLENDDDPIAKTTSFGFCDDLLLSMDTSARTEFTTSPSLVKWYLDLFDRQRTKACLGDDATAVVERAIGEIKAPILP